MNKKYEKKKMESVVKTELEHMED
ncbi:MAG: hypothetical protein BAJALOKI2v1_270028 [Promethearchaeota archaeon]|nr:MAG: hypothetical protein BAJALOKI2v1_270028 [Candidatus Lokiarchaeota archaeon]